MMPSNELNRVAFKAILAVLFLLSAAAVRAQSPPYIEAGGALYNQVGPSWLYTWETDAWGTYQIPFDPGDGSLGSGMLYSNNWLIDIAGNIYDANCDYQGSYDSSASTFSNGAFAVGGDGQTILSFSAPLIILDPNSATASVPYSYFVSFWNGSNWVQELDEVNLTNDLFQAAATSPWYAMTGNSTTINGDGGWPASNLGFGAVPQYLYINGRLYNNTGITVSAGGTSYSDSITFTGPGPAYETAEIDRYWSAGSLSAGAISGTIDGVSFTGTYDSANVAVSGVTSGIAISFSEAGQSPQYGPQQFVTWGSTLLPFVYSTSNGDVYWSPGTGSGDYTVLVAPDGTVTAINSTTTVTGQYTAPTTPSSFTGISSLYGPDANGNPQGLPAGMTFIFGFNGPGQQLLAFNGTPISPPAYTYRGLDGSWRFKFTGLSNGPVLIQDENSNYTAPPYLYQPTDSSGNVYVYAVTGWPQTTLYPGQLFVNGIECVEDSTSQYISNPASGNGLPRNGGVTYRAVGGSNLTALLTWTWGTNGQFSGQVRGAYGQGIAFSGRWDGMSGFTNLSNGATVSLTPSTSAPTHGGPPQVAVNGTPFAYNQALSTSNNADSYVDSLGDTLVITPGTNAVTYTPAAAGATALTGSYDPVTHQFSFVGASPGTVTATDTAGHNLADPAGAALAAAGGSGAVTELAGSLDVGGNAFTLGTWTETGGASINGFTLLYSDYTSLTSATPPPPSLLTFSSTRAQVAWNWNHPSTDGGSTPVQAMTLDSTHRVLLYDPNSPGAIGVTLDPSNNGSAFHTPVRAQPQGDILMGPYQNSPVIP